MSTRQRTSLRGRSGLSVNPEPAAQPSRKTGKTDSQKTDRAKLTVLIAPQNLEALKVRAAKDKRKIYEIVDELLTAHLGTSRAS